MTKQEILDKYIPCQCWPAKDGGKVYNTSCPQHSQDPESAMDEWAKLHAIRFVDWIVGKYEIHRYSDDDIRFVLLGAEGLQTIDFKTIPELYKLFATQIKNDE